MNFIRCHYTSSTFLLLCFLCNAVVAQKAIPVSLSIVKEENKIDITAGGKPFTSFVYADTLAKPFLFPVLAPGGQIVTRGFPLATRTGDTTDHPHHTGIWFNYENVNGLDFWNNSYAIAAARKHLYGSIKTDSIVIIKSGKTALLSYSTRWQNAQQQVLLQEKTTLRFTATAEQRIIDRVTTLTALQDVLFKDVKDGLLGMRVARELQMPTRGGSALATGNYISSAGATGNAVWGTRAAWCLLYGKMGTDTVSIAIIDHPKNPGYPAYWHARGYGLFAVNPLGQAVFSNGKQSLQLALKKGETVTFRYRIVIASGEHKLSNAMIAQLANKFGK